MTALSAVAGSAMANDFNFEVNGTPNVDENGYVAGTNDNLQFKDSKFSFAVNNGDEITLTSTGKVTVKLGETVLKVNEDGVYKVKADGTLTVELAKDAAVTKIVVVSSNSIAVQKEIDKAYDEMGKAIAAVAKYVTYEGFYTRYRRLSVRQARRFRLLRLNSQKRRKQMV